MPWTIYCHIHVESGRRYVGMTARTMERRWSQHVVQSRNAKNGRWHFPNAIRKHGPEAFSHEVLEVCGDLVVANLAEECWIEFFDTRNPEKGFNLAKGGGHTPHPAKNPWDRPGFREKVTASLAKVHSDPGFRDRCSDAIRTKWQDPDYRAAATAGVKATWQDPEHRARMTELSRELLARPEIKEKIAAVHRGKPISQERKDHLSSIHRGKKRDPEVVARVQATLRSPECRARMSKSQAGRKTSEETRAKLRASSKSSDPEVRARIAASVRAHHERRRAGT